MLVGDEEVVVVVVAVVVFTSTLTVDCLVAGWKTSARDRGRGSV
jgi:hypothetical protein